MSATPSPSTAHAPASFGRVALLAAIVAVIGYGLDQFTKYLVVTRMELLERIEIIPGVLRWYSIRNSGAAFSMGEGYTWVFTIFMAIVAVGVLVFLPRVRSRLWALALGGLFAGTMGNLTDRLFQPPGNGMGHVVDFISVGNFAIFNIADSLIVCSVITVVLLLWTGVPVAGGPRVTASDDERPATKA
ncbi:signal peptidase II [Galactobacter valiniphilus]|uniref:signal peptidase II n=1 Tax=Galactobacter valiniphilus TaxID=2676122 RepID=UPI003735AA50